MAVKARVLGILALSVVLGSTAFTQQSAAVVTGTVLDSSGGHIPEVVITALNVNTGVSAMLRSNEAGVYTFASLPPGEYRFTAEKPGFRKRVIEGALLRVGDHFDQNILLEVGALAETVEITGGGDAITYLTSTTSTLITSSRIESLPAFGRHVMDFVTTAPGVISTMTGLNVNGSRTDAVNVALDGINILDNFINESITELQISLSTDRIEELRVVTSPADAEFGLGAAQVLAASRTGTNRLHGAAYDYLRNDALNANGWTNNRTGIQRPLIRENNTGARLDGPIIRNRTFFFGLFESDIERSQRTATATVLTEPARAGIFRFYPGVTNANALSANPVVDAAGNPLTPRGAAGPLQSTFLFGRDPSRLLPDQSGAAARLLEQLPLPNTFGAGDGLNTAGYRFITYYPSDTYSLNARLDHNLGPGERFFISYARDAINAPNTVNAPALPSSKGGLYDQYGMVASAGLISTLRPNLVNELRTGVTRTTIDFLPAWSLYGNDVLPEIGGQHYLLGAPLVTNPYSTASSSDPQARLSPLYQASEKISWLKGIHNFKAGFDARFVSVHEYLSFNVMPRVNLGTGNVATQNIRTINGIGSNGATADNLLALLSGSVASMTQMFYAPPGAQPQFVPGAYNQRTYRQREFSGYAQDDVRLRRNLTVNFGLRWEYYGVPYEANGGLLGIAGGAGSIFGISRNPSGSFDSLFHPGDMSGSLTQLQLIGRNSPNPVVQPWRASRGNFGPVAGLAWNLPWQRFGMHKMVLRAGYAVNFERLPLVVLDNVAGSNQPGLSHLVQVAPSSFTSLNAVSLPLQPTQAPLATVPLHDTNNQPVNVYGVENLKTPYIQSWNVSLARELFKGLMVDARYAGTKGTKLYRGSNINEVNIFENGILDAIRQTDAGGSAPLFDRIFSGLNVPGVGLVDGGRITGSDAVRGNGTLNAFLLANNAGGLAQFLAYNTFLTGVRGGLIERAGLPANFVVANPQFGAARLLGNAGNSTFHALQLEARKSLSRGVQVQASYVRSKALGDYEGNGQDLTASYETLRNRRLDKHLLNFDFTNVWRVSGSWDLPFGPGRKYLNCCLSPLARALEGWQTAIVFDRMSGAPTTFTDNAGGTFNNQVMATPDVTGALPKGAVRIDGNQVTYFSGFTQVSDPAVQSQPAALRSNAQLFAIAGPDGRIALQNPALGTLGGGYVMVRGPGSFTLNAQVSKSFHLARDGGVLVKLRADAVNLLNTPLWNAPNLNIDSVNFGLITSAGGTRNVQVGARIEF